MTSDATDEQQVHTAVAAIVAKLGPHPEVLCNNAGSGEANWFETGQQAEWHSVDIWRRYLELNLNSVYLVSREVVPRMKSGAAICNTSSIAGMLATPVLAAYAAAKAGVISYTRTLALQRGPKGYSREYGRTRLDLTKIWEELGAGDRRWSGSSAARLRHRGARAGAPWARAKYG